MNLHTSARTLCLAAILLMLAFPGTAEESYIVGVWLSGDGDGWIELRQEGEMLSGYIAGSPNDKPGDPPRFDVKNPDLNLRERELLGMQFMQGFRYDGEKRWTGGSIYDPNSGKTYKGNITLVDRDTLKLRGYIGVALFGRSETWTRRQDQNH
jgi:uncharacterized protein (DUF2147 family)